MQSTTNNVKYITGENKKGIEELKAKTRFISLCL
jgi:hypothetical protein